MNINTFRRREVLKPVAALLLSELLQGCMGTTPYAYRPDTAMPEPIALSPRLQQLFAKTKRVCVGRYALEVPQEAVLRWGPSRFPAEIDVIHGGIEAAQKRIARDIAKIKGKEKTAEITENQMGTVANTWRLRFYEDSFAKESGLLTTRTYISRGDTTFITGWTDFRKVASTTEQQDDLAKRIRLRAAAEVPDEPGFCIEEGFISDNRYDDQETASAGIFLPSFPDINFSLSSNKDAYADYKNWAAYKPKLSLLARIAGAQQAQGPFYPSRTLLREGKRDVQHWHGEESLIRRKDGTHDFEWAFVGTPRDVANPSEYGVHLYSKVAHDTVGAAAQASLTDDEVIALWDKLLSGLKFRVQVPGAPEGSYYTSPSAPMTQPPPVVWCRDQLCPKDGYYKLVVDDPTYPYHPYLRKNPPSPERAGSVFDEFVVDEPQYHDKAKMIWVRELDDFGRLYSQVRLPIRGPR